MGVTICGKTKSIDVAYGSFYRLRLKVAELSGLDIYLHYKVLPRLWVLPMEERKEAIRNYDRETEKLSRKYRGEKDAIFDFLYAPDAESKLNVSVCAALYKVIRGYSNDSEEYGYAGLENGSVHFDDFKAIVKECALCNIPLQWHRNQVACINSIRAT